MHIGLRVCGRGAVHLRPVRADLPGGAPAAELPVPVAHCPAESACLPRGNGLSRQAVQAVVLVGHRCPLAEAATLCLQPGQHIGSGLIPAAAVGIPIAYRIIVVLPTRGITEGGLLVIQPVQVIVPEEALREVGVCSICRIAAVGQLGVSGQLTAAVVGVLVHPPAFGAFHGMQLPGGCVGILLMDALSLTRTGVSP